MLNHTLVIVTTDNGGPAAGCAVQGSTNQPPRRGGKCTVWQGGTTGDAFLSGPALWNNFHRRPVVNHETIVSDETPRIENNIINNSINKSYPHLFHAVDWLPTLAAVASAKPNGNKPLDGVNHWEALLAHGRRSVDCSPPPREEVFVGYATYGGTWYGPAVRYQNWKLLQGQSGGPENQDDLPPGPHSPARGGAAEDDYRLYNLDTDPGERHDVSEEHPVLVQILRQKLREYQRTYVPPIESYDPDCGPFRGIQGITNTSEFGLTWAPWCTKLVVYE